MARTDTAPQTWHRYSGAATIATAIREWAKLQNWRFEYREIGTKALVEVYCNDAQWRALMTEAGANN